MPNISKHSLPRHTILAKYSTRVSAFLLDLAIGLLFFLVLFYGCSNLIVSNTKTNALYSKAATYELYSHLVYYDKDKQKSVIYESTEDYTVYQTPVKYYYLNFLTGNNIEIPEGGDPTNPLQYASPLYNTPLSLDDGTKILPKDYYNINWYNYNVLGITNDDPDGEKSSCYFTYVKDGEGKYDKTKLGVPRTKRYNADKQAEVVITNTDLASFYKEKYVNAYYHFADLSFYKDLGTEINFYTGLAVVSALIAAGMINYIIIPMFSKFGSTLGKRAFKLGLASSAGYSYHKYQLLLRFIPYLLTSVSIMFISSSIYVILIIVAVMFLTSFALSMASPRRMSLHDFVAQTIVIDQGASTIFDNSILEEEYLMEEDKEKSSVVSGEEPELTYEK